MNFDITKLDKRHSWHKSFDYMIEFKRDPSYAIGTNKGVLEFDRARKWFNETYGWSQDVETREEMIKSLLKLSTTDESTNVNRYWAYSIRYQEYRIYICNESALTMFNLKWANNAIQ